MGERVKCFCFANVSLSKKTPESNGITLHCCAEQAVQPVPTKIVTQLFNLNLHAGFTTSDSDINKPTQISQITIDNENVNYLLHMSLG